MRPLRIQVFQHVSFEGLGSMGAWARAQGHAAAYTRLYAGEKPPSPESYDWLIVMGGPMGVYDEAEFPWLKDEKQAVENALQRGRPVLGICLGAQLLAEVLGAKVGKNREREIGWFPVTLAPEAAQVWPGRIFPKTFTPFHWHGDTFGIPAGAVRLAGSEACPNQAFLYGEKALGLQFHPEVTAESLEALAENCASDLKPGNFVQETSVLQEGLKHAPALNAMTAELCAILAAAAE